MMKGQLLDKLQEELKIQTHYLMHAVVKKNGFKVTGHCGMSNELIFSVSVQNSLLFCH